VGQVALVGRDAELERLAVAAAAAAAGRGKIVLISGESGIGKTAILTWLVDRAAAAGARIASGAAEELEMRLPFAAVSDCLGLTAAAADPKAAEIAAMLRGAAARSPRPTPSSSSPRRSWGWSIAGARRTPSCWPSMTCSGPTRPAC
jgi:predicted ATPase